MAKKEINYQQMAKGFLGTMKDWIDILGERNKLMIDQMGNEQRMKQNFFYNILMRNTPTAREKQQMEYQQGLGEQFQRQGQGAQEITPEENVFTGQITPEVRQGTTGYQMHYPGMKEGIYKRIQLKKQKGYPLSEQEQKFEQRYLMSGQLEDTNLFPEEETEQTEETGLFPEEEFKPETYTNWHDIQLPDTIQTTSEAKDFLMQNYQLSEEDAIEWIRNYATTQR